MVGAGGGDHGPVVGTGAFGALPAAAPGPRLARTPFDLVEYLVGAVGAQAGGEVEVDADRDDVGDGVVFEQLAERGRAAVDLVGGHPGDRGLLGEDPVGLFDGDRRLGAKGVIGLKSGLGAAVGVGEPAFLYVQVGVDQAVSTAAGVGGVDRHDRVGDLPGGTGVLPPDPGGVPTGLLLAALVEDQPGILGAQVAHRERPDPVADLRFIPLLAIQEALLAVRAGIPGRFGDPPAVLALQPRAQRAEVAHRMPSRLPPTEHVGDLGLQLTAHRERHGQVYADGRGRPFLLRHNIRILDGLIYAHPTPVDVTGAIPPTTGDLDHPAPKGRRRSRTAIRSTRLKRSQRPQSAPGHHPVWP